MNHDKAMFNFLYICKCYKSTNGNKRINRKEFFLKDKKKVIIYRLHFNEITINVM